MSTLVSSCTRAIHTNAKVSSLMRISVHSSYYVSARDLSVNIYMYASISICIYKRVSDENSYEGTRKQTELSELG